MAGSGSGNPALHYVMAMLYGAMGVTAFEKVSLEVFVKVGGPRAQMENAFRRLSEIGATETATP